MERKNKEHCEGWSIKMVSGVEYRCKVKAFAAPELPSLETVSFADIEYDFLCERQVIADHEEYLKTKKHLNQTSPTPACDIPASQLNLSSSEIDNRTVDIPSHVTISNSEMFSPPHLCPPSVSWPPPPAASHFVSGQILVPSILDGVSSSQPSHVSEKIAVQSNGSSSEVNHITPDSVNSSACTYLKDFDNGPDDPFAMTELKTINELEELKKILTYDSFSGSSLPNTDQLANKETLSKNTKVSYVVNNTEAQSTTNSNNLSYSSSFSSNETHTTSKAPEALYSHHQNYSMSYLKSIHSNIDHNPRKYPQNCLESGKLTNDNIKSSTMKLDSYPHEVKSNTLVQRPHSCAASGGVVEPRSFASATKHQSTVSVNSAETNHNVKLEEDLLSWATSCGFSHSHARRLLELGMKKRVFNSQNLEQNKLILLNLLHTFNSLLTNFSTDRNSSRLLEQSALVIALTFPNDLSKAQQLARLVIYLEDNGFSQDIISFYIQNPQSIENEELARLLNNLMIHSNMDYEVNPVNSFFSSTHHHSMMSTDDK
ncbi:unnamed protein product [Heterobilharzia americana]|nr:unnamed protein product [Heterobilharzia americana]CAH8452786.1 unnamed protein product [Heterobilharzia americana]